MALVLASLLLTSTPAQPRTLIVDAAALMDDMVVGGTTAEQRPPAREIVEPVDAPPVSLTEATKGLVSGGADDLRGEPRSVERALEDAARRVILPR